MGQLCGIHIRDWGLGSWASILAMAGARFPKDHGEIPADPSHRQMNHFPHPNRGYEYLISDTVSAPPPTGWKSATIAPSLAALRVRRGVSLIGDGRSACPQDAGEIVVIPSTRQVALFLTP